MLRLKLFLPLLFLSQLLNAQDRYDKDAFARSFFRVFQYRNIPDSLNDQYLNGKTIGRIPFPGAECTSEPTSYQVRYPCKDSVESYRLFRAVQDMIRYATSPYGVQVKFVPEYPEYQRLYLVDSGGLTYDQNLLILNKPDIVNKSWYVLLSIDRQPLYFNFTRGSTAKADPALASLFEAALGKDTTLASLKGTARKTKDGTVYTCKKTVPGFSIRLNEMIDSTDYNISITNELVLTADFAGTEKAFLQKVEQTVNRIRASLPPDYCFRVSDSEPVAYFNELPWSDRPHDAYTQLRYFQVNPKQPGKYRMELVITREKEIDLTGMDEDE